MPGATIRIHELGHAVAYSLNDEEGLLRILPAGQVESIAVVFEFITSTIKNSYLLWGEWLRKNIYSGGANSRIKGLII